MGSFSGIFSSKKDELTARIAPSASTARTTLGIVGHGLILGPICPCRVAHLENGALFVHFVGEKEKPMAMIKPGTSPASDEAPVSEISPDAKSFKFGTSGPTISLKAVSELAQVFVEIHTGQPDSPWVLLCEGFWIDLPAGFVVLSASPEVEDDIFEIHLVVNDTTIPDAFMCFLRLESAPPDLLKAFGTHEGFTFLAEGVLDTEQGEVIWVDFEYIHEGEPWRRRYYSLPFAPGKTYVMNAGSPATLASRMFSGADMIARSFRKA